MKSYKSIKDYVKKNPRIAPQSVSTQRKLAKDATLPKTQWSQDMGVDPDNIVM